MPETKQTKQPPKASPALPAPRPAALPVPAKALTALERFYQELRRIPKLDREEEERLARLWREKRDYAAGQRLILHGLHTVAAIAREYRHFGLPEEDLIQEGVLGLMHAINRFDPDRGFRLSTYASWWIRAAIHDYILRSWSIVKVGTTKLQRRIFAGLQRAKHAIAALEGKNLEEV
ncbi:MAG: sigma-70 family RNA polymerase sigma factor, partial [Zetaproteobacteria bacterium]